MKKEIRKKIRVAKPIKKRIHILVLEEIKNDWIQQSEKECCSLTDFIINKIEGNKSAFFIKTIEGYFNKMGNDRKKVENNINQISRNINISKGLNEKQMFQFLEILGDYKTIVDEQNKIIIKVFKDLHSK